MVQLLSKEESALKIRIKFAKRGSLKFIGHLDVMRYFQKVIKRAKIDIAYSEGFSPHQKMSFAAPLGVGLNSEGEYVDIEVNSTTSSKEAVERLNQVSIEDIPILSYRLLPDNATKAMTLVCAADYRLDIRAGYEPIFDLKTAFTRFMEQESIVIVKETKKSQREVDLKPLILKYEAFDSYVCLQLVTGSVENLKPELVMDALYNFMNTELAPFTFQITRLEVYGKKSEEEDILIPLESFGEEIE